MIPARSQQQRAVGGLLQVQLVEHAGEVAVGGESVGATLAGHPLQSKASLRPRSMTPGGGTVVDQQGLDPPGEHSRQFGRESSQRLGFRVRFLPRRLGYHDPRVERVAGVFPLQLGCPRHQLPRFFEPRLEVERGLQLEGRFIEQLLRQAPAGQREIGFSFPLQRGTIVQGAVRLLQIPAGQPDQLPGNQHVPLGQLHQVVIATEQDGPLDHRATPQQQQLGRVGLVVGGGQGRARATGNQQCRQQSAQHRPPPHPGPPVSRR